MPNRRPRPRLAARLLAPALALLVLVALPAVARADGWVRGLSLSGNPATGGFMGYSDLGADAAGNASIAWFAVDPAATAAEARLTRIAPDGSSTPSLALGSAGATDAPPGLAVAPTGAAAVAWVDDADAVQLVLIPAGGAPRAAIEVAPGGEPASFGAVTVGVSDGGDAVVAWSVTGPGGWELHVRRVTAGGLLGPHEALTAGDPAAGRVAVARDGNAWVTWVSDDDGSPWAARLTAAGAIDGAPVQLSSGVVAADTPVDVVAGGDSAVASWVERDGGPEHALQVSRLAATGAVAGAPVEIAPEVEDAGMPEAAITAGGAIVAVYNRAETGSSPIPLPFPHAFLRRVEADGSLGPERRLGSASAIGGASPRIAAGGDGTATVTWIDISTDSMGLVGFQLRADGSSTPTRPVAGVFPLFGIGLGSMPGVTQVATSRAGVATAGWIGFDSQTISLATARYDGIAPAVEAIVPANVSLGSDASFAVNVRDDGGVASVWWEFGDESGSRRASTRHRYADPGVYAVSVTVTDHAGNETTVTRQVSVVAPPPVATRVPAALKLSKVARKGAKVTVTGTLDRRARGRMTVAYSQRIGRRSHSKRVTAKITDGRFRATLRLTGALARARGGKATVKVSYAGDATTNTASATKTVAVPRAKAKKKPKQQKRAAKRR